ncbi:ArsR/SmtB family transcription factor [Thermococcus sp.]
MQVKVKELIGKLNEKQKKTVMRCMERCDLIKPEDEVDISLDKNLGRFLKLIGNPIRFQILKMLRDRELCVCLISQALEQDQTLISHHLRTLKELNLVTEKREGKLKFYRANTEEIRKYLEMLGSEII